MKKFIQNFVNNEQIAKTHLEQREIDAAKQLAKFNVISSKNRKYLNFHKIKSILTPNNSKKKFLYFIIFFAIIGAGYLVYYSYAATTTTYHVASYNIPNSIIRTEYDSQFGQYVSVAQLEPGTNWSFRHDHSNRSVRNFSICARGRATENDVIATMRVKKVGTTYEDYVTIRENPSNSLHGIGCTDVCTANDLQIDFSAPRRIILKHINIIDRGTGCSATTNVIENNIIFPVNTEPPLFLSGYWKMPTNSSYYSFHPPNVPGSPDPRGVLDDEKCGSADLIGVAFLMAHRYRNVYGSTGSRIEFGDFNANHITHKTGVNVDIRTNDRAGAQVGGRLNEDRSVDMAKWLYSTGKVKSILFNDAQVINRVNPYVGSQFMIYSPNHDDHFHITLNDNYALPQEDGCPYN